MEALNKLKSLMALAEEEGTKFYEKGNSMAGTRLRRVMMDIKTIAHDIRADVSSKKAEAKAKS